MWLVAGPGPGYLHTATTDAADAAPQGGAGDSSALLAVAGLHNIFQSCFVIQSRYNIYILLKSK